MTLHITVAEANAWADKVKLNFGELDSELENAQATQVLSRVSQVYNVSSWVDSSNTPSLIRKIIAMLYVGWYYQGVYSEDDSVNSYGLLLINQAETLVEGIISGAITLTDAAAGTDLGLSLPAFYPNDASSALKPTDIDSSLGPEKFSMGKVW